MARSVASGRTAATNRVAVQDIKSSLMMTSSTSYVSLGNKTYLDGKPFTFYGWVKPTNYSARLFHYGFNFAGNAGYLIRVVASGNVALYTGNASTASVGAGITPHQWVWLGVTYDGSSVVKYYKNGIFLSQATASPRVASGNTFLCAENTSGNSISTHKNQGIHDVVLTDTEMALAAQGIQQTRGQLGYYTYNEGAGTTAYDTSGNGNHGTITAGTYTSDVPTKKRGVVGGNLVYNGDFEYAPPFTAATTTSSRWIDGTAAGSTTNNLFGWATGTLVGTSSVKYDNAVSYSGDSSLKLSTSNTGSSAVAFNVVSLVAAQMQYAVPIQPNTSYTYSFMLKTNVISGSATTGAQIQFKSRNAAASNVGSVIYAAGVITTQDWTRYTGTFTTHADARYMTPQIQVVGNDGTATLIMDAWFDDIQLRPTVNTTRTAV